MTRRIAKHMNRSVETIRYTLKQFDEKHPAAGDFPGPHRAACRTKPRGRSTSEYRSGTSVDVLAKRFGRTKTSIYRVVNEMRATQILELPLDYMYNEEFDTAECGARDSGLDAGVGRAATQARDSQRACRTILASLYEVPLLTREQEQHLFRKFNYLKHKASQAARAARSGSGQEQRDGPDRAALRRGGADQEPDRARPICGWSCRLPSGM